MLRSPAVTVLGSTTSDGARRLVEQFQLLQGHWRRRRRCPRTDQSHWTSAASPRRRTADGCQLGPLRDAVGRVSSHVAAHRQPLRLELVTVADVDRVKVFYVNRLGFTDEQEHRFDQTAPLRGADAAWLPVLERADRWLRGLQARFVAGRATQRRGRRCSASVPSRPRRGGLRRREYPRGRFCSFINPGGDGWRYTSCRT